MFAKLITDLEIISIAPSIIYNNESRFKNYTFTRNILEFLYLIRSIVMRLSNEKDAPLILSMSTSKSKKTPILLIHSLKHIESTSILYLDDAKATFLINPHVSVSANLHALNKLDRYHSMAKA